MMLFQFFRGDRRRRPALPRRPRENLLRKMRFPRLVIPMAVTLGALFDARA